MCKKFRAVIDATFIIRPMHRLFSAIGIAVLAAFIPVPHAAAQGLVITNARILDGKGGVLERGTIVLRDGTIASVSAGSADAGRARVIDAKGMTVMPGFIDAHRHPIGGGADWLQKEAPARMQEFLDAGFTTMLSAGDDINAAIALRQRIASGAIKGPRLIVLGRVPTAGAAAPQGPGAGRGRGGEGRGGQGGPPRVDPARSDRSRAPRTEAAAAVPDEQARATVESLAKAGVDGIKTNIIVTPGGPEKRTLTLIVKEASRYKLPVITHAVTVEDTIAAVEAGVQTLAHTPHIGQLTMEQARMIAKAGIPMMSTLGVFVPYFDRTNTPLFRDGQPFPWETLSSAGQGPVNARLLSEAGVTYGYGTDTSWLPKESLALELRPLGLVFSPKDIVSILTRNAAAAVHRSHEVGTLEAGKLADLVVVNGDPLADVDNLLNVAMVIKGGEIVIDKR
jgi:imidazolonepropionase-like amidohydrolase